MRQFRIIFKHGKSQKVENEQPIKCTTKKSGKKAVAKAFTKRPFAI